MSFGKLLVANRGEISVRVIRACGELGIRSVAVYSEADEQAMHRRLADEAYPIGPSPATESYLHTGNLIEATRLSGAEAVHPGYGFLSESAPFARAVEEAGAVWVGPPPEAMELMGLKVRAKELAREAGVPTLPGYSGEDESEERLLEEAEGIGYPVLVKASAGGGGRGMRPVLRPEDFAEAVRGARREAEAAFGDGSVFLERLVENPRHVEVQIIADHHGNTVHLYERECSIQRRHQKVVEESPSPALDDSLREAMGAAAVRLAREAGYRNAGTVEFLLDASGEEFYFLEMNARLQVEHPVTELVTGLDLVHLQLSVAAGEALPFRQEEVSSRGSAIEVRLYAEEEGTALPAGGELLAFAPPEGPGIRNDTGVERGDQVSLHYDPMLAKLVVYGAGRETALLRLRRALEGYTVLGVPTNLPLLRRIAAHPAFAAGETTIDFLEKHSLTETPGGPAGVPEPVVLLAALAEVSLPVDHAPGDPYAAGHWRLGGAVRLCYSSGGEHYEVEAVRGEGEGLLLSLNGREATARVVSAGNGTVHATLDGENLRAGISAEGRDLWVSLGGESYRLSRPSPPRVESPGAGSATGRTSLTAPMPGTVAKVVAGEGEEVEQGQLLLVLEAMKMEQAVSAPYRGRVRSLPFAEGALVPGGAVLAEVEELDEA